MEVWQLDKLLVHFEHEGAIARMVLNDPKANVLDHVMMSSLSEALSRFRGMPALKAIVLEGTGRHFSYGASVAEHTFDKVPSMLKQFHGLFYKIRDLSIPMIAKVHGQCLGGGFELAMMCHFLFAESGASMGLPEITLGVFPPPASFILNLKIGVARAESLILTGKPIDGKRAKAIGLVEEVYPDREALENGIREFIAAQILPKSASSLRYGVAAAREFFNHIMDIFLGKLENIYIQGLMNTHDANEGINAFLEKRKPEWKNR